MQIMWSHSTETYIALMAFFMHHMMDIQGKNTAAAHCTWGKTKTYDINHKLRTNALFFHEMLLSIRSFFFDLYKFVDTWIIVLKLAFMFSLFLFANWNPCCIFGFFFLFPMNAPRLLWQNFHSTEQNQVI